MMPSNHFTVTEIVEHGHSPLSLMLWLVVQTASQERIIFWGHADNHANIDTVQQHHLPFQLSCQTYATSRPGVHWAVTAETPLYFS
jgi:hypothetical protein